MSHNIATINGKAALALARKPAWHELGTVVDHLMVSKEAIELAQLDSTVDVRQLEWNGNQVNAYGIFRTSDDALFGTCSKLYKPIQTVQAFEIADALLELADGGAYYESAGALGNGERVWLLARIPGDFTVAGEDEHKVFLLVTMSHDGTGSLLGKLVDTRVVCNNTLTRALGERGSEFRIPHFGDVTAKIEAAKKLMAATGDAIIGLKEKFDILAARVVTRESFLASMDKLFPETEENLKAGVIGKARSERIAQIADLFTSNDNNAVPSVKGTGYNLLNAITEYQDHFAGTDKTRARSAMFGSGEQVKTKALDVILETTAGAPVRQTVYSRPSGPPAPPAPTPLLDSILSESVTVN